MVGVGPSDVKIQMDPSPAQMRAMGLYAQREIPLQLRSGITVVGPCWVIAPGHEELHQAVWVI